MSVIVIDQILRERFLAASGETEVRDETGQLIGRFIPSTNPIPDLDMTAEEIAQALSPNQKTYTTSEVLAHVKGVVS